MPWNQVLVQICWCKIVQANLNSRPLSQLPLTFKESCQAWQVLNFRSQRLPHQRLIVHSELNSNQSKRIIRTEMMKLAVQESIDKSKKWSASLSEERVGSQVRNSISWNLLRVSWRELKIKAQGQGPTDQELPTRTLHWAKEEQVEIDQDLKEGIQKNPM